MCWQSSNPRKLCRLTIPEFLGILISWYVCNTGGLPRWRKKKIILLIILLCIAGVIGLITVVVLINASRNNKVMHETIEAGMRELRGSYTVTPRDAGDYEDMRFYGMMKFHVDQYDIQGLGNLSVLTADMGFMQMVSYVITPYEKNVPLCTLDFMYIMGNRKSYVEFYDLVGDTQTAEYQQTLACIEEMQHRYDDITELETTENWYDKYLTAYMHKELKRSDDVRNQEMFCDALKTYLDTAKALPQSTPADAAKQLKITKEYSDGLIDKGGVSTDVFKKAIGEEKTREFFDQVFFGSALYGAEE